jgi:hypothetical protein
VTHACEYGVLSWNNIDRGELLIHPPEISDNPISSHQTAKQEELENEMVNFALRNISFIRRRVFLECRKILRYGAGGFTSPPKEGVLRIFIALKNSTP